jgi:hypothetical protein
MQVSAASEPAEADNARESHALAFRIAFAAAVGLTLGEVLGWDFPFLPAMLAVQLLSGRGPIGVKQGLAFVSVMAVACAFAVLVAQVFAVSPLVLLLVVSLVTFLAFLLLARGQAVGVAATFLITTAVVPLLATESMSVAYGFIHSLVAGSALAVLLTFAAHAFFPIRVQAEPVSALAHDERDSVALALANTAVLMSLVIYFMLTPSPVSIVLVLTVISILRQHRGRLDPGQPCRRLSRDRGLSSCHATSFPGLSFTCRLAGRAYLRRPYRAGQRVGTDLYGWTHDVPDLARAWTLAPTAGQRHALRCPCLRRHGGGRLCHRHGQPLAFGVSCPLTSPSQPSPTSAYGTKRTNAMGRSNVR